MDSASEKYQASKDVLKEDRISNLPSSLIGHILSLLPTVDAVATSVLSTRWKNHWTLVSSLEFCDDKVLIHEGDSRTVVALKRSFINFVYRILQRRSLPISKLHIYCDEFYDASHVIAWVSTVLRSNIRELEISVAVEPLAVLPWNLFICETLVEMKLGRYFVMDVPISVSLPCLKILCLHRVKILDDDSLSRLLGGCPVLEELSMWRCIGEQVKVVHISAPALTSLNLTRLQYVKYSGVPGFKIVLRTPKLSYLIIDGAHGYEVKVLNNLCKVKICFDHGEDVDKESPRESLHGLLEAISKVKSLEFEGGFMRAIISSKVQLPEFQNVIELELGYCEMDHLLELLPMLLNKMPCLTILTFMMGQDKWGYRRCPKDVPDCLLRSLKKIEITNFRGFVSERELVKYFIKNARVLEKMIIHDEDFSKTPRASSICKMEHLCDI